MSKIRWETLKKHIDLVLEALRLGPLSRRDIREITGFDAGEARRLVDTISLSYPVYEIKPGIYSIISEKGGDVVPFTAYKKALIDCGILHPDGKQVQTSLIATAKFMRSYGVTFTWRTLQENFLTRKRRRFSRVQCQRARTRAYRDVPEQK